MTSGGMREVLTRSAGTWARARKDVPVVRVLAAPGPKSEIGGLDGLDAHPADAELDPVLQSRAFVPAGAGHVADLSRFLPEDLVAVEDGQGLEGRPFQEDLGAS